MENQLHCQHEKHKNQYILGVCIFPDCQSIHRAFCYYCKDEMHQGHATKLFVDLDEWTQEILSKRKGLIKIADDLQNCGSLMKQILIILSIDDQQVQSNQTISQLDKYISGLVLIQKLQNMVPEHSKNFHELVQPLQIINKGFISQTQQQAIVNQVEIKEKEGNIEQQQFLSKGSLKSTVLQTSKKNVQNQFQCAFLFSNTFKKDNTQINNMGRVANINFDRELGLGFVICDAKINFTTRFAFKMLKIEGKLYIGICVKKIALQNNLNIRYGELGHGLYAIDCYSAVYSHSDEQINCFLGAFKFNKGDIVIITVDIENSIIQWEKQGSKLKYSMNFDSSLSYHPFIMSEAYADVEIINY